MSSWLNGSGPRHKSDPSVEEEDVVGGTGRAESVETQASLESESGRRESLDSTATQLLSSMESCFLAFDQDGDGGLNHAEFGALCRALFQNERDKPYHVDGKILKDMFETFDIDQDALIDEKEFESCWQKWIKKIVRPVTALVIVDVQNDFISGSLAIANCPARQNGEEVVEPINKLIDTVEFDCVFYSLDWHPENHVSFLDNVTLRPIHESSPLQNPLDAKLYDTVVFDTTPLIRQKLWPRHCVQNSWGAKLHENLKVVEGSPFIYKGTNPEVDSYSAFFDNSKIASTTLFPELSSKGVTDVYVCGLAYDICVGATSLHSSELGFRTILIDDASRGITLEDMQGTQQSLKEQYGIVVDCEQVKAMVQGRDRRVELGYKLALDIKKEIVV